MKFDTQRKYAFAFSQETLKANCNNMTPGHNKEIAPSWLNDEFLQAAVRRGERDDDAVILSSHITFDTGVGDHYASTMYKVKISVSQKYEGKSRQKDIHLLIKTLPKGEISQDLMLKCGIFPREIKMFSETLPAIRDLFQKKRCSEYEEIGARYYYHSQDDTILVVENLAPKGFRMAKRQVGLDLDHSMLVMKLLAKYHASSIALRCENPQLVDSYPKHPMLFDSDTINNFIQSTLKTLSEIVLSWPNGELYSKNLLKRMDTFMAEYTKLLEYDPSRYNVLSHGDLWMGNMLFRYNENTNNVEEVKFVDFQISCLSSPGIDLQYFIYTSPREDARAEHSEDLLKEYHKVLCDTLVELGHGDKAISFEELMDEYEKCALQSVFGMLIVFPIVAADPEDAMDLEKSLKDNEGDSRLRSRLSSDYVTKVLKKYIPIFVEKGLL